MERASFKLNFDYVVDGQMFLGLEHVNSTEMSWMPPCCMNPGVPHLPKRRPPAARTGWATVEINGTDFGIYTLSEVQDEVCLNQWWDDTTGSVL